MTLKSYTQQRVEAQHDGKDIKIVLMECLEAHRGLRNLPTVVAAELGVSDQTIYNWCSQHEINLDDYR